MIAIICFTMRGSHNGIGQRRASIYEPTPKLPTWFRKRKFAPGTPSKFAINPKPKGADSPSSNFSAEERAECLKLVADGMSTYQAAKAFGVARTTVIRWAKQAKMPFSPLHRSIAKEQIERMVAMSKSGMSQDAIAKELGITQGAVSRRLKPYSQKAQQCTLTKEQVEEMLAMCQAGMSQDAIAKRFGVSQGTVSRQLKKTVQPCS